MRPIWRPPSSTQGLARHSHGSAAHHRELIKYAPRQIHVSTPRAKVRSLPGFVIVHAERERIRVMHDGIPTTTIPQTLLDLAATGQPKLLARALATLDYRKELDVRAIERTCGKGRRGSGALRKALEVHQPRLAYANGELEEQFLEWCVRWELPLPELNVRVAGELVDAYWPGHRLVVELDGYANTRARHSCTGTGRGTWRCAKPASKSSATTGGSCRRSLRPCAATWRGN